MYFIFYENWSGVFYLHISVILKNPVNIFFSEIIYSSSNIVPGLACARGCGGKHLSLILKMKSERSLTIVSNLDPDSTNLDQKGKNDPEK